MLNRVKRIEGSGIHATDGDIGKVKEAFFDDEKWTIRYLVVETGNWLAERKVLISPYAIRHPVLPDQQIAVRLSRQQVEHSPDVDTHQPVSRQHERRYLSYYDYPDYWSGVDLWGVGGFPMLPPPEPPTDALERERAAREADVQDPLDQDSHLRSSAEVSGYDIQASDGSIGHVSDFIFDDESWAIRYLLVDTRNWWPGGKKVLIATPWIDEIVWSEQHVKVGLSREQIKNSPEFDETTVMDRDYETRLHQAYGRRGYWDF
jgi:uncharacterized protein YrrD